MRNREFVFTPKIEYKLVAERSEANQNRLIFPFWCSILELVRTHFSGKFPPRKFGKAAEPHRSKPQKNPEKNIGSNHILILGEENFLILMEQKETLNFAENPETVISGSFRKNMEQIGKALEGFEKADVKVLAPTTKEAVNPDEEFIILATDDPNKPPHKLEMDFMREIRKADFLYVANVDGYVGQSAATEMAYARLKNLPVVVAEVIKTFSSEIPEEAQELLRKTIAGTLGISDISKEKIAELKQGFSNLDTPNLTEKETRILQALIKKLLKDLKSLPK